MVRKGLVAASLVTLVAISFDSLAVVVAQESCSDGTNCTDCLNNLNDISRSDGQSGCMWFLMDGQEDQCLLNCNNTGETHCIPPERGECVAGRRRKRSRDGRRCRKAAKTTKKKQRKRIKKCSIRKVRKQESRVLITLDDSSGSSPTAVPAHLTHGGDGGDGEFDDWLDGPAQYLINYLEGIYGARNVLIDVIRPGQMWRTEDYIKNRIRIFIDDSGVINKIQPWS
jgi:hypothetical protein